VRIDLRSSYLNAEDVAAVLRVVAKAIDVDPAIIDVVVVVGREHYGAAVREIDPTATFSDNPVFTGAGKALRNRKGGNLRTCAIVLWEAIVADAVAGCGRGPVVSAWNSEEQAALHIVAHEMGHCKDYSQRLPFELRQPAPGDPFSIRGLADYYGSIVMDETAASAFSSPAQTQECFRDELAATESIVKELLSRMRRRQREYDGSSLALATLGFETAGIFWLILVQYSKLLASQLTAKRLRARSIVPWDGAPEGTHGVIEKLREFISHSWDTYPEWSSDSPRSLVQLWHSLTEAHDIRFITTTNGDGIYWG